ncbi:hypothetical protein PI124_g19606 [Phytophthora idaei]|nr:hypothetical protein PI125_g18895 [Phytophthora idaei]KAG3134017.1 hypothetical protein PI126_g18890 [Phytophthora idaei]KAG3235359.1 hypothetical protein PI124_g19606 [Phytophthora idaei]
MECRRSACTSAAITADTRSVTPFITTFKLNAEITHSRVEACVGEGLRALSDGVRIAGEAMKVRDSASSNTVLS